LAYAIDELNITEGDNTAGDNTAGAREYRQQLLDADDRMMQACSALDEIVIARRDNRKTGLQAMKRAAELIPSCEAATRSAASLISDDD